MIPVCIRISLKPSFSNTRKDLNNVVPNHQ